MKILIRVSSAVVTAFSLFFSGSALSQSINITSFKKSYEATCVKEQVKRHAGIKGITADQFAAHCECTSTQLSKSLNTSEIETLLNNQARPNWFKEKELAAAKSCLKQEPKIQVRFLNFRLIEVLG
jgi:hypothetical protein